jgi:preprotein translocase subunit YajC
MNTLQLTISFVVFGCLLYLMQMPDKKNTNLINNISPETDFNNNILGPKIAKDDKSAVRIIFYILLVGVIFTIYLQNKENDL